MNVSSDQGRDGFKTPSASALRKLRNEILEEWLKQARLQISEAKALDKPMLTDTVPVFIDNLAEALEKAHPRELAVSSSSIAKEHGGERARVSKYGPEQLIKEYQILRHILVERLEMVVSLSKHERSVVQKSFDQAMQEAMNGFFLTHTRIREQFIASLSHDLRNPIGANKMAAELMLTVVRDCEQPALRLELEDMLRRVINNSKRADRLIQNILDASVLQVGEKLAFRMKEVDFSCILRAVTAELDPAVQARIQVEGTEAKGHWDKDALRRAFENLTSNAIKYGSRDTPISIRVATINGRAVISVHNEGNPIPKEDQEQIFQAFSRSHSAQKSGTQGWGIGLALVREVTEGHGGCVIVDSSKESGTTFSIDIPLDSRPYQNASTLSV